MGLICSRKTEALQFARAARPRPIAPLAFQGTASRARPEMMPGLSENRLFEQEGHPPILYLLNKHHLTNK